MSYKYLSVVRVKKKIGVELTDLAIDEFPATSLVTWLKTVIAHYHSEGIQIDLGQKATSMIHSHENETQMIQKNFSEPSMFLREAVDCAMIWPINSDFDENLHVIHLSMVHAEAIRDRPISFFKIGYSVKKHQTDRALRLMTLRGDFVEKMGREAALLAISALKGAVSRELGANIVIINLEDFFGKDIYTHRPAPNYGEYHFWRMVRLVTQKITDQLDVEQAKKSSGIIKVLSDHFKSQEVDV